MIRLSHLEAGLTRIGGRFAASVCYLYRVGQQFGRFKTNITRDTGIVPGARCWTARQLRGSQRAPGTYAPGSERRPITSLATPPQAPEAVRLLQPNAPQLITLLRPFILGGLLLGVANGPARPVLARPVCGPSKNGPGRAGPSNRNGPIFTTRPV